MNLHAMSHRAWALGALGLALAGAVHAADTAPEATASAAGIFKAVEGEVLLIKGDARSTPQVGQALAETDRIQTGPKSGAAVTLADGTVVSIGANSTVALSAMRYEPVGQTGNLAVQIVQGTLRMITGTLGKTQPENVKVNTPTAVIGVRGTDFIVEVKS
jgi:hypothetical protein